MRLRVRLHAQDLREAGVAVALHRRSLLKQLSTFRSHGVPAGFLVGSGGSPREDVEPERRSSLRSSLSQEQQVDAKASGPPARRLSRGWQEVLSEGGEVYYANAETGESSWVPPASEVMNEAGEAIGFGDGGEAMAEAMAEAFGEAFGNAGEAMGEAGEAVGEAGEAVGEAAPAQARPSSAGPATPTRSPSEEEAAVRTPVVHSNSKATGASESQTATLASSPPSSASERASPDVLSIDARADGAAVAAVEEPPSKKPSDDVTKASSCDEGGGVRVGEGDDESPEAWAAEMGAVADGLDAAALVERGHHANQEGRYAEARECWRAARCDSQNGRVLRAAPSIACDSARAHAPTYAPTRPSSLRTCTGGCFTR
eukprot:5129550-Prymnesium_polylepis.1